MDTSDKISKSFFAKHDSITRNYFGMSIYQSLKDYYIFINEYKKNVRIIKDSLKSINETNQGT